MSGESVDIILPIFSQSSSPFLLFLPYLIPSFLPIFKLSLHWAKTKIDNI